MKSISVNSNQKPGKMEGKKYLKWSSCVQALKRHTGSWNKIFNTKIPEIFRKTCHFIKKKKDLCPISCAVNSKSKDKKEMMQKVQCHKLWSKVITSDFLFKSYDFTKGSADIIDQFNDCYSTYVKSQRWVMVALYHMLDVAPFNAETTKCLKKGLDVQSKQSWL